MIIGITGKSGSGKSTLSKMFDDKYYVLNIDKVAHEVLEMPQVKDRILLEFGIDLNVVSRVELGDIIFNGRHDNMKILTDITWRYMQEIIDDEISKHENIILEWILLPHAKYFSICDIKILVVSDKDKRFDMIKSRDGIGDEYINKRESNSIEYNEQYFDHVFINDYTEENIRTFIGGLNNV